MRFDSKSLFITVVVFCIAILMLFLLGLRTPLPVPSEKGFIIDFGNAPAGRGEVEPAITETKPVKQVMPKTEPVKETYVTQDIEEAPSLPTKMEVEQKEQLKEITKTENKEVVKKEEKKVERKVNPLSLYKGNSEDKSSGEGDKNDDGNQGSQEGIDAGSHFIGNAGGMGVADVGDRVPSALPNPDYNIQEEGIVVVKVRVDKSGKVIYALPGVQGSTKLIEELLEAAKKAALSSRFQPKYDGATFDEGTITYKFKLK